MAIGTAILAITITGIPAQTPPAAPTPPAPPARARARVATAINGGTYLGIGVQEVDADRAKALKLKEVRGAEVTNVNEDSPAAKAGIKDGDVLLEWNGQPVESGAQLARLVRETPAGRQVKVGVWRNGAMQSLTATLEAGRNITIGNGDNVMVMPEVRIPEFTMPNIEIPRFQMLYQSPMLGIVGEALGQQEQLAEFFGVKEGVLVKSVNKNSAAEKAGIKAGDVILRVDDSRVNSTNDITAALRTAARAKKNVTVTVMRSKKEMSIPVVVESASSTSSVRASLDDFFRRHLSTIRI